MTTTEILSRLEAVKPIADRDWMARCPAHKDRSPSLKVTEAPDGKTLFRCFAGCKTEHICAAINLKVSDLFPEKPLDKNTVSEAMQRDKQAREQAAADSLRIIREGMKVWPRATTHPYLENKKLKPSGDMRIATTGPYEGWLVVPIYDADGQVQSVQYIAEDGTKKFQGSVPTIGGMFPVNEFKNGAIVIGEGFATSKSLADATGWTTVASFTCGNIPAVAQAIHKKFPDNLIIIASDDDHIQKCQKCKQDVDLDFYPKICPSCHKEHSQVNAGVVKAQEAAKLVNGIFVKPTFADSAEGRLTDFNDLACVSGNSEVKRQIEAAIPVGKLPPEARSIFDLERHPSGDDPSELLKHRYLCIGGGLLFCGPTGIGKSVSSLQCALLWAVGRPSFGIEPAKPLKSLFIQAENDDGDLAEMRDGVIKGLGLDDDEIKQARKNVFVCREDAKTGIAFFNEVVKPLLELHRPQLLWIDPALAYIGGDVSSQKDVGQFLRNWLNPLLHQFECGAVIIHHTNKPASGKEKVKWSGGDFAYLGSGSAEWANWARAILALRSIGSHNNFELHAAKRGKRLRWVDENSQSVYVKHIEHATDGIYWRESDSPPEEGKTNRPAKYSPDDILAILPKDGLKTVEWQKKAKEELGVSSGTFYTLKNYLAGNKTIVQSVLTERWMKS